MRGVPVSLARSLAPLVVVALALAIGLAGCGGDGEETTAATTTEVATTTGVSTAPTGDPAAGKEVFLANDCGSCHTLQDAGTTGAIGPNLDTDLVGAAEAAGAPLAEHVRTSIVDPDAWVMPRWSNGVMPRDFGEKLSDDELDDLVAYIVQAVQQ